MTKTILLTRNHSAIVDASDYEWLNRWKWYAHVNARTGRISAQRAETIPPLERMNGRYQRTVHMHRLIMQCPENMEVDHINGNALDNRRENLRLASSSQNKRNRRSFNKHGLKGIAKAPDGRWRAVISLGTFDTKEEAARAYDKAARLIFGQYARANYED